MKIFHIADLHLGKRVNEFDMIETQQDILSKILIEIEKHRPKALILAGDIYDRSVPSAQAVKVFDNFLNALKHLGIIVYIITGNHDSKERLSFASGILEESGYYIAANITKDVFKHSLDDTTDVYMVPFLRPSDVRTALDSSATNYDLAFGEVMDTIDVDKSKFNILVAHQFFTASGLKPEQSESEIVSVGGVDNIDIHHLNDFDYVALGHIHSPQSIGKKHIRYAGSILKYSQSEVDHRKSITVLDINNKELEISTLDLIPNKDMVHIRDTFSNIMKNDTYNTLDYTFVTLLDEDEIVDALSRLRAKFPSLMSIKFENLRTAHDNEAVLSYENLNSMSDIELFNEFFKLQNNQDLTIEQKEFVEALMEDINETN